MDTLQKIINLLPTTPGVYLYKDASDSVIYIGKAVNLKRRVKQYFNKKHTHSPKTQQLIDHIVAIDHINTITEFDALLLEANLIKTYQPKYNSIAKDDKSPIYISIPFQHSLPTVSLIRKPQTTTDKQHFLAGPFQSTTVARSIMRSIRKCIPFCTQKKRNGHPCFYTHINLCDPCPSEIIGMKDQQQQTKAIQTYRKNMYKIKRILEGHVLSIIKELEHDMEYEAHTNQFEKAAILRDRINHIKQLLGTHFDPSMYVDDAVSIGETLNSEMNDLYSIVKPAYPSCTFPNKIECFDISHTAGSDAVGSLVVLQQGIIDRGQYRKFAIKDIKGSNDTEMMYQVILRRLKHPEWPYPDIILVDGGKGQVTAAERALHDLSLPLPVIGLAKLYESIVLRINNIMTLIHLDSTRPCIRLLKRIRDESHRFAVSYHRVKRAHTFLPVARN